MCDAGTIRPEAIVVDATKRLVHRLRELDPTEDIDLFILNRDPLHAQYVRTRTGEVLAEIVATQCE